MVPRLGHIILTRFNVRIAFSPAVAADTDWLHHRFELFDRFCYPSVRAQTNSNFRWLVFFDAGTPPAFRERIAAYAAWDRFVPCFVRSFPEYHAIKRELVRAHVPPGTTHLLTTRLDSDDALATDFVDLVQAQFAGQRLLFINYPEGFVLQRGKLYLATHRSNPFISLIETIGNATTVWNGRDHNDLAECGPLAQLAGPPRWLRVVHDRNVVPRTVARRRRVRLARLEQRFVLRDGPPHERERTWTFAIENALLPLEVLAVPLERRAQQLLVRVKDVLRPFLGPAVAHLRRRWTLDA